MHHAQRHAAIPLRLDRVERAVDGMLDQREQVALQPHHDGLGLRIAHAAVELQHLDVPSGVIIRPAYRKPV